MGRTVNSQALLSRELQYASLGRLLALSIYCYSLVFSYLPPDSTLSVKGCTDESLTENDHRIMNSVVESEIDISNPKYKVFCLETATMLYELANQIYYDPQGFSTQSSFGPFDEARVRRLGFELVHFASNPITDSHGMVLVSHKRNRLVCSFRGTASVQNLATDINGITLRYNTMEKQFDEGNLMERMIAPKIHKGFLNAFNSIWEEMREVVAKQLEENPDLQLFTTGHSLGGALATICAYELKVFFSRPVLNYTFGCPRVGNHKFAEIFDKEIPISFRIVNDRDIITSVPKRFLGWFVFKHSGTLILIDRKGNIINDLSYVEGLFRGGNSSLGDHGMASYLVSLLACYDVCNWEGSSSVVWDVVRENLSPVIQEE